jgi:hypothetical protein
MPAAAKLSASMETAKDSKTLAATKGFKSLKATTANNYSPQDEAQRRKWGVETSAVRSVHARKF